MKFLFALLIIALIGAVIYFALSKTGKRTKQVKRKPLLVTALVVVLLLSVLGLLMYRAETAPDAQCTSAHVAKSVPPATLITANDYFAQGNYDYDTGNCRKAIVDYTKSLSLNPDYPQAYNNRAYTYMRLRDYEKALPDLNKAIAVKPDYIQALMNRGDLYNYYGPVIDKQQAVADYQQVIALGGTSGTSVCGHLYLAKHNGWNFSTGLGIFNGDFRKCQ